MRTLPFLHSRSIVSLGDYASKNALQSGIAYSTVGFKRAKSGRYLCPSWLFIWLAGFLFAWTGFLFAWLGRLFIWLGRLFIWLGVAFCLIWLGRLFIWLGGLFIWLGLAPASLRSRFQLKIFTFSIKSFHSPSPGSLRLRSGVDFN